jgi:hypothetical protein
LEDSKGFLINVPVLIRNFMTENSGDDKYPNKGSDMTKWIFSRRFMIYDTISGIRPGGYVSGEGIPDFIRWAYELDLKVTMD